MLEEQKHADVAAAIWQWLDEAVIAHALCPFAAWPRREGRIALRLSGATDAEAVGVDLQKALDELAATPAAQLETTLLVTPDAFADFYDYNDFLGVAEDLLQRSGLEGVIQIASFHPHYCFAGAEVDDPANFTNRAPYPIFHLLREASIDAGLAHYPAPEEIPRRNIAMLRAMSADAIKSLFPHCFSSGD